MIGNIVDRRSDQYTTYLSAVVEPSWNDNGVVGSTKFLPYEHVVPTISEYPVITLQELIRMYVDTPYPMTLYLYDIEFDN